MSPLEVRTRHCVRDVMTAPVVAVRPDARLEDVAHALAARRIGAVPVVDRRDRVVGVVAESDLLSAPATSATTAAEVMSTPVVVVEPEAALEEAQRAMAEHRIGRLPVVDGRRRLIGILARRDLLAAVLPADADVRCRVTRCAVAAGGEVVAMTVVRGAVWMRLRISDPGDARVVRRLERAIRDIDGVTRLDLDVEPAADDTEESGSEESGDEPARRSPR